MKAIAFSLVLLVPVGADAQQTASEIDKRLEELKTIWYQEQAIINHYTRNRTKPVKEGSKEYHACLEASKRIQLAEKEAAELKTKKNSLAENPNSNIRPASADQDDSITKQMKAIIAKVERGEIAPDVAEPLLQRLTIQKINKTQTDPQKTGIEAVPVGEKEPYTDSSNGKVNEEKIKLGINHAKLIGFWRSVEKSDIDNEYNYCGFSISDEWHFIEWIPYNVVREEPNALVYSWIQDTGNFGKFEHTTRVEFLNDGKIKILGDKLSKGIVYERLPEAQWTKEQDDLDEEALRQLRSKLQGISKQLEHK